jgi:hypothetical protein
MSSTLASGGNAWVGANNLVSISSQISQIREMPIDVTVDSNLFDQTKKFLGIISETPGEIAAAAERELIKNEHVSMIRGLQLEGAISMANFAVSAYQVVSGVRSVYKKHMEIKRWTAGKQISL